MCSIFIVKIWKLHFFVIALHFFVNHLMSNLLIKHIRVRVFVPSSRPQNIKLCLKLFAWLLKFKQNFTIIFSADIFNSSVKHSWNKFKRTFTISVFLSDQSYRCAQELTIIIFEVNVKLNSKIRESLLICKKLRYPARHNYR
eukprot:UN21432